jgi:hypothetical protein
MKDVEAGAGSRKGTSHAWCAGRWIAEAAFRKEKHWSMTTTTKSKGKETVSTLATQLIAGTNKRLATTTQVLIAGESPADRLYSR